MNENDIYNEILKVSKTQIRIEEQLKGVNKHLGKINGKVHDHCKRIKVLENYKIKTTTVIGVVTVIISVGWAIILFLYK